MSLTDKPTFYTMCARVDTTVKDLCQPVDAYSGDGCLCGLVWAIGILLYTHTCPVYNLWITYVPCGTLGHPVESCARTMPTLVACG